MATPVDPGLLQRLQAQIDADPDLQAALRLPKAYQRVGTAGRLLQAKGIQMPHGYTLDMETGKIIEDHQIRDIAKTTASVFVPTVLTGVQQSRQASPSTPSSSSGDLETPGTVNLPTTTPNQGGFNFPWAAAIKTAAPFVTQPIVNALAGNGSHGNGSGNGSSMNLPPELSQLLNLQTQRIQQSQPLYDLMLRYASAMMPTFARTTPMPGGADMQSIIQRLAVPR
jgi:hypothetical protein